MNNYSQAAIDAIQKKFEEFKAAALNDSSKAVIHTCGNCKESDALQLTEDQINGLVRCWTDDTTAPYYLARSQMSPNWYITDGVIITVGVRHNNIFWKKGVVTGIEGRKRIKHQVDLTDNRRIYLYLQVIYGIVTGNLNAPEEIKQQITEQGLYAFGRSYDNRMIDVHHINGSIYYNGQPMTKYEEQNKDVQLLPPRLHTRMHTNCMKIVTPSDDDRQGLEQLCQMGEGLPEESNPYMIVEHDNKTEYVPVNDKFSVKDDNGDNYLAVQFRNSKKPVLIRFYYNGQCYYLEI